MPVLKVPTHLYSHQRAFLEKVFADREPKAGRPTSRWYVVKAFRQSAGKTHCLENLIILVAVTSPDSVSLFLEQKVMQAINGAEFEGREVRCNDADNGGEGAGFSDRRSSDRGGRRYSEGRGRSSERGGRSADRGGRSSERGGRSSDRGGRGGYGSSRSDDRGARSRRRSDEDSFAKYEKKSKVRGESADASAKPSREDRGYTKARGKKDDWKQFFNNDGGQLKGEVPDFSEEGWARR